MVEFKNGHVNLLNISKNYTNNHDEKLEVLNNLNLEIDSGSFVSLIGRSGCGKSTLLRLISGLEIPSSGEVLVDGINVEKPNYRLGYVFQKGELFQWLNVEENISFGLKARGVYKEHRQDVSKYIEMVGLKGFEKSLPGQLSGGMAQRVALARTLINRPKVLLLDEPLGALDRFTRNTLQDEIINIWKKEKITVIMVTHDVEEALYMSEKIVVLSKRPAQISEIIDVKFPYPREKDSLEFIELKKEISSKMNEGEY